MNIRLLKLSLAALSAICLASFAGAQVYAQQSVKTLTTLTHWTEDTADILDSTVDAAGNRYLIGLKQTGSDVDSYIMKITKKGFLSWYTPISNAYVNRVAVDNLGSVYVAIANHATNHGALMKFSRADGSLQWLKDNPWTGSVNDVAVTPSGIPVTAGNGDFGQGYLNCLLLYWDPAGVNSPNGWLNYSDSTLYSLCVRPSDGAVIGAGYVYDDATGITSGQFLSMNGDFTAANSATYTTGQYGEYFRRVVCDPVTGTAVAMGQIYADDGGLGKPVIATCYAHEDGTWQVPGHNYPFYTYDQNGVAVDLETDSDGHIFFAAGNNLNTGNPPTAELYTMSANPGDPSILDVNWWRTVPDTDRGTFNYATGLGVDAHGPILMVTSDLSIGLGSSAYTGYQAFSFDAATGASTDRQLFGIHSIVPDTFTGSNTNYNDVETAGGYLTLYGYTTDVMGIIMTAKLDDGPDDTYRTDEDTPLHVGIAKSVLNNDGNQFLLDGLTAQIQGSSVSAGIHSVTLNPDGTFDVTLEPNFNGLAKFKYRVKQNGVVIATNQVKINVKPKNDAPTAENDSFNVAMNSAVQNLNVLGNDSDIDGDNITIFSKTNNANATIGITPDKKFITFKPKNGFSGDLTFTYTIRDPQGLQSTATVSVHVS